MPELPELLELAKSTAASVGRRLEETFNHEYRRYTHCKDLPKEIKAMADTVLEEDILQALAPSGLSILSEESGYIPGQTHRDFWFIVDPLDGTFNFVKGLGPCAVSIALWKNQEPVFGVVYSLMEHQLVWGGREIGAFADGRQISVSQTSDRGEASLCTGFPVRFDFADAQAVQRLWDRAKTFAKIRMLGSATMSLLYVARGAADAYSEENIMLWDVAAGLAIVEGAGGRTQFAPGAFEYSLNAYADNGALPVVDKIGI